MRRARPQNTPAHPASFTVGVTRLTFTDRTRPTLDYADTPPVILAHHRTLVVELRYPVMTQHQDGREMPSARPALRYGPFPVIVFAPGYAVVPDTYARLLDAWVQNGFVVASPIFPVTNYYEWARHGGGGAPEQDVGNQPADVAFVVSALASLTKSGRFAHLLDLRRVALAGHSDGAATVAGLAFASYYRRLWAAMPIRPRAVVVLSGAEFDGAGAYRSPARGAPSLLVVQSDADHCDMPWNDTRLYNAVAAESPTHYFLALHGATHIAPFVGLEPWAKVVDRVTTYFLRLALNVRTRGRAYTAAGLVESGADGRTSHVATAAHVELPLRPPRSGCGDPAPYPSPNA